MVKKQLSRTELISLGQEMQALFDELIVTEPRQKVPAETSRAAQLH